MSMISTSVVPQETLYGPFLRSVGRALKNWWIAYATWRLQQLAISRLRSMSDRELQDIGISRGAIEFTARSDADRQPMFHRYY